MSQKELNKRLKYKQNDTFKKLLATITEKNNFYLFFFK